MCAIATPVAGSIIATGAACCGCATVGAWRVASFDVCAGAGGATVLAGLAGGVATDRLAGAADAADAMPIGAVGVNGACASVRQLFPTVIGGHIARDAIAVTVPCAGPEAGRRATDKDAAIFGLHRRALGATIAGVSEGLDTCFAAILTATSGVRLPLTSTRPVAGSGVGTVSLGEIARRAPGLGSHALVHVGTDSGHTGRGALAGLAQAGGAIGTGVIAAHPLGAEPTLALIGGGTGGAQRFEAACVVRAAGGRWSAVGRLGGHGARVLAHAVDASEGRAVYGGWRAACALAVALRGRGFRGAGTARGLTVLALGNVATSPANALAGGATGVGLGCCGALALRIRGVVGNSNTKTRCREVTGHAFSRTCVLAAHALGAEARSTLLAQTAGRPKGLETAGRGGADVAGHALRGVSASGVADTSIADVRVATARRGRALARGIAGAG